MMHDLLTGNESGPPIAEAEEKRTLLSLYIFNRISILVLNAQYLIQLTLKWGAFVAAPHFCT
jgi:hypothetical protein